MGRIYRKQSLLMFFAVCRNTASQVKRRPNDATKLGCGRAVMLRPMLKLTQWGHWVCELWTWLGQHWPGSPVLTCWCSQNIALQFLVCLDLVLGNAGSEQGFEHRPAFVCFHLFCLWEGESGAVLTHQSWFSHCWGMACVAYGSFLFGLWTCMLVR